MLYCYLLVNEVAFYLPGRRADRRQTLEEQRLGNTDQPSSASSAQFDRSFPTRIGKHLPDVRDKSDRSASRSASRSSTESRGPISCRRILASHPILHARPSSDRLASLSERVSSLYWRQRIVGRSKMFRFRRPSC